MRGVGWRRREMHRCGRRAACKAHLVPARTVPVNGRKQTRGPIRSHPAGQRSTPVLAPGLHTCLGRADTHQCHGAQGRNEAT